MADREDTELDDSDNDIEILDPDHVRALFIIACFYLAAFTWPVSQESQSLLRSVLTRSAGYAARATGPQAPA